MGSGQKLKTKILRRTKSSGEYAVYRAALEWGLTDPIVIKSRDDFNPNSAGKTGWSPFTIRSRTSSPSAAVCR